MFTLRRQRLAGENEVTTKPKENEQDQMTRPEGRGRLIRPETGRQ